MLHTSIKKLSCRRISELEDKSSSVECSGDIRSGECGREAERQSYSHPEGDGCLAGRMNRGVPRRESLREEAGGRGCV